MSRPKPMTAELVEHQVLTLPTGLVIHRSFSPGECYGIPCGCAISKTPDETQWYASDYWGDPATPMHFGPFPTETGARSQIDGTVLTMMDEQGTDGTSAWLVLP